MSDVDVYTKLAEIVQKMSLPKVEGGHSCSDILDHINPLLDGAVVTVSDEIHELVSRNYIKSTAVFSYNGGEVLTTGYARIEERQLGLDAQLITGVASSYARKSALNGLLCLG